ncbi:MAG: DUF420 domain-containing protein [Candidatus Hydrogenedentes bacterium]|nr:DUF420 domain-containing protein [Candidatus Hydrogenedentota bacterium]
MPPLLPTINATLNGLAGVFLILGWRAIRSRRVEQHKQFMFMALLSSAAFLTCYLYYHFTAVGITRYQGQGILRALYFFILLSHTPLAALMTPFILAAVWFALKGNFTAHTRITKWLWPIWMYVSVTGVLIYLMLYLLPQ